MMKLKVNRLTKNLCFQPKMSFLDYLPSPLPPKDPFGSITPSCFPKELFLSLLPSLPPSLPPGAHSLFGVTGADDYRYGRKLSEVWAP